MTYRAPNHHEEGHYRMNDTPQLEQPVAQRILLTEEGQGWDAAQCVTCMKVLGPWPQEPHGLADCVHALALQQAAT